MRLNDGSWDGEKTLDHKGGPHLITQVLTNSLPTLGRGKGDDRRGERTNTAGFDDEEVQEPVKPALDC